MGYNKIPLALRYNDTTNNAEGLIEFQLNLSDVGDVCVDEPGAGQALVYRADGDWCPSTLPAPGAFNGNLSDVGQVCDTIPNNGQSLVWFSSTSSWCPSTITGGGGGGTVTSVNSVSPTGGDVLLALNDIEPTNSTVFNSGGSLNVPNASVVVGVGGGGNTTITGSTGQLSVTNGTVTTTINPGGYINLPNITAATTLTEEGDVGYDQDANTFAANVGNQDLIIHMGEDQIIQTYNNTGATIGSGLAVYVSGTDAQSDRLAITLADKDTGQETQRILGVTTRQILNATQGFIQTFGKLELDTRNIVGAAAGNEGDPVFLGDNGALTITKPTLPTESVIRIGKLEKFAEDGLLFIDVQHGFVANDLDDVNVDINSVVITNGASAVSSLSGASGSIVYFEGATPAPGVQTINTILENAGISFVNPSRILAYNTFSVTIPGENFNYPRWSVSSTNAVNQANSDITIGTGQTASGVTFNTAGDYQIDCAVTTSGTGAYTTNCILTYNGGESGFVDIGESISYSYGSTSESTAHITSIISASAGGVIAVKVTPNSSVDLLTNGTTLRILRLT